MNFLIAWNILILLAVADKNLEKHCNATIKLHHRVYFYNVYKNTKKR